MKGKLILISAVVLTTMSCAHKAENTKETAIQKNSNSNFDIEFATKIVEQRSKEFEEALKIGDSIAVGDIYTLDTKVIGAYSDRAEIVREVFEMRQNNGVTGIKLKINNIWGNENIIVEDAYFEFFHRDGTLVSKGESLIVWKKEKDKWRIFRDIYKPEVE